MKLKNGTKFVNYYISIGKLDKEMVSKHLEEFILIILLLQGIPKTKIFY